LLTPRAWFNAVIALIGSKTGLMAVPFLDGPGKRNARTIVKPVDAKRVRLLKQLFITLHG